MTPHQRSNTLSSIRSPRMTRRAAMSALTGIGLVAGAGLLVPSSAAALRRQDGGTPAAPPAPATPPLGEQPDGTVTWHVLVGHMIMDEMIEAMAIFPNEITINAGDRIFFDLHGFHTVTFPGEQDPPALFVLESDLLGTPAAAGDSGRYVANPAAAFPSGPPLHDGASLVNSGLPDPTMPPFTVEFTSAGTFDYVCLVHPSTMKASVIVQEQGAERPHDQAYYDQLAMEQMDAIIEQGRALVDEYDVPAEPADGGTVWDVVAGVGQDEAQVLRFLPERLEISAGDTVRWTNLGITEPHTVTFLGDTEPPELVLFEPQAAGPPVIALNPEVIIPTGDSVYQPGSFANSGWLQGDESEFPEGTSFPETWELTFDQPGEYPYYCVLHATAASPDSAMLVGMVGTIVVT